MARPLRRGPGRDAADDRQRPQPPTAADRARACRAGRDGVSVRPRGRPGPDRVEPGLAPDGKHPADGRELTAQSPPLPLEPRLGQPCLDLRQAVTDGLDVIRCRVQHTTQDFVVVAFLSGHAPRSRPLSGPPELCHVVSNSRTTRSAATPLAVWLLTAPRLIPIAVAICASERSA